MLRKLLRIIGWIAGGAVAVVLLGYLAVVAVNWRDAEPSPEAVRFAELQRDRPVVADEDNAWVYLKGFEVAPPKRDEAVRAFIDTCRSGGVDCVAAFETNKEVLNRWLDSERGLLERYRSMLAHSGWRETIPSAAAIVFPSYSPAMDGQRLLMVKARLLAEQGDYAAVQQLLEDDLRFWRRVLASSDMLISRMIAVSAVKRHFEVGNLIVRKLPPGTVSQASLAAWFDPISDAERAWNRCLAGELEFASAMLRSTEFHSGGERASWWSKVGSALASPLYLPQDTINKQAAYNAHVAELLNAPLDRYQEALDQATELANSGAREAFPPRSLYNIAGTIVVGAGRADFRDYGGRVADLEGVRRAALAALTLREEKVAASDVAAALASGQLRNPYDGRPFAWDEQAGMIVFRGLASGERGEYRIYY